jgi:hypothetical protein
MSVLGFGYVANYMARVATQKSLEVTLGNGYWEVILTFGFMPQTTVLYSIGGPDREV